MRDLRVKTNQIELQVREYEHDGQTIVFLHFGGANLMMWQKALPYFVDRYHLLLVDMRGHGKSDEPDTGYDLDTLAEDIAGLMQTLNIKKAHILGSSMGSEVGLALAANHPELVHSFVAEGSLFNEFGAYSTNEDPLEKYEEFVNQFMEKVRNTPVKTYQTEEDLLEAKRKAYGEETWNDAFKEMEAYGIVKLGEGQYASAFRKKAKEDYFDHFFHNRLEEYYRRVKCPILMIPDSDEVKDEKARAVMQDVLALTPNGKLIELENWTHPYGWLDDPKKICQVILGFYERLA